MRWFIDERHQLAWHLKYLDVGAWPRVDDLWDAVEWLNIALPGSLTFTIPGSCWTCDRNWIEEAKRHGHWAHHPGLEYEIVLWHCAQIVLTFNPLLIARQFGAQPNAIAARLNLHLSLERLGGPVEDEA
jgi:hypothetical protein